MTPLQIDRRRHQALKLRAQGLRVIDVCKQLRVSPQLLQRWEQAERERTAVKVPSSKATPAPYYRGLRWGANA